MSFFWYIWHGIIGCKETDIEKHKNYEICKKCGKITFYFD